MSLITVLYVDDDAHLLNVCRIYLEQNGGLKVETVLSAKDALARLATTHFDAIVSDYEMPKMDGIEFLKAIRKKYENIPFIIFTGRGREEIVIEAINSGADFYLQKGGEPEAQFAELAHKIRQAVKSHRADIILRNSEEKFRELFNSVNDAIHIHEVNENGLPGKLIEVNDIACSMLQYPRSELLRKNPLSFSTEFHNPPLEQIGQMIKTTGRAVFETGHIRKDGTVIPVEINAHVAAIMDRSVVVSVIRDISERRKSELVFRSQLAMSYALQKARTLKDVLEACLNAALDISGMDSGGVYLGDPTTGDLELALSKGLGEAFVAAGTKYPANSLTAKFVAAGKPEYFRYSDNELVNSAVQKSEGLQAIAVIPILIEGQVIACLNVSSHTSDVISEEGKIALETISAQIGSAIVRIRSEEALAASEVKYRNVVEDQTELISRFLPDGTHIFVNQAYCRYFGRPREQILNHQFRPVLLAEDRDRLTRFFASLTPDNPVGTIEQRILMPDGSVRWQLWTDRAIFDASGKIMEYQSVGRDSTEQRIVETALQVSEEKYRSLFDNAILGIFRSTPQGKYIDINPAFARIAGYESPQDMIAAVSDIQQQLYVRAKDRQRIKHLLSTTGEIRNFETEIRHRDGHSIWISINAKVVQDASGHINSYEGTIEDITTRKEAERELAEKNEELNAAYQQLAANEEELRQNYDEMAKGQKLLVEGEERFRLLFENMKEGLALHELLFDEKQHPYDYRILAVNKGFEQQLEIRRESVLSRTGCEAYRTPEAPYLDVYSRVAISGKPESFETYFPPLDRHFHISVYSPKKNQFATIFQDITEEKQTAETLRKKNEELEAAFEELTATDEELRHSYEELASSQEALRRNEDKYRRIVETASEGIWAMDQDLITTFVNRQFAEFLGCTPDEMIGRCIFSFLPDEEKHDQLQRIEERRAGKSGSYERRFLHKNGEIRWAIVSGTPIFDRNGTFAGSFAMVMDITDRKRSDEALKASEARFRTQYQNNPLPIFTWQENKGDFALIGYNLAADNLSGGRAADYLGSTAGSLYADRPEILDGLKRCFAEKSVMSIETVSEHFLPGRLVLSTAAYVPPDLVLVHMDDVTERRQAERALKESEEKFRRVIETSLEGIWILDTEFRITFANSHMEKYLGYRAEEMIGRSVSEFIVQDEFVDLKQQLDNRRKGISGQFERQYVRKDGTIVILLVSASPIIGDDGTFKGSFAMFTDITKRKRAESSLQESEEKYRMLLLNSGIGLGIWSLDGDLLMFNDVAAHRLLGKPEDFAGKHICDIFGEEQGIHYLERIRNAGVAETPAEFEDYICLPSGNFWYRSVCSRICGPDGSIRGVQVYTHDITPGKIAEQKLNQNRVLLDGAMDLALMANWELNVLSGEFTFNDRFYALYGTTVDREGGYTMPADVYAREFVHPDDAHMVGDEVRKALATRDPDYKREVEHRMIRRDGSVRTIVVRYGVKMDAAGKVVMTYGVNQDITEWKHAKEALLEAQKRTAAILEGIVDIFYSLDTQWRFTFVNAAAEKAPFNRPGSELIGNTIWDLYPQLIGTEIYRRYLTAAGKQSLEHYESQSPLNRRWYEVFMKGWSGGVDVYLRDITTRRMTDAALQQANRQLNILTSITRHDILNNITAIRSYLSLAQKKSDSNEIRSMLDSIDSVTQSIQEEIEFTRIYKDLGTHEPQWQNIGDILEQCIFPGSIAFRNDAAGLEVFADPMFERVFYNLLDNTIRHGEGATLVSVSCQTNPDGLILLWEDNGCGIPAEEKEDIFNRGFGKNTGLGLYLIREILGITGIKIRENGEPGRGVRFEIQVPAEAFRSIECPEDST
jgi:PAS domain S-box-containing protein